jgi:hypothetical protein
MAFIAVALAFLGGELVGWRLVARLLRRRLAVMTTDVVDSLTR